MLQNKIYRNFLIEILKTFLITLFGLTIIAFTVRAVNFLDLIVENGYPIVTYFKYTTLNLFGIAPKFIPLSFLISLIIFILKHKDNSEFVILWTSGVKKIQIVNLFLLSSLVVLLFYLFMSTILTPIALNKSRQLLGKDHLNSFIPTVRAQQFSDSFKSFTFIVEKKINNEVENIFLHDEGNNLRSLSSNLSKVSSTTVVAKKGIVEPRQMILFNGQIISSKENNEKNEVISFDQLNVNLDNLVTTTIKKPKIQETSTFTLMKCFTKLEVKPEICREDAKKEFLPSLIRRFILPFYIPCIALICSLLLLKNNRLFINKFSVFFYSFFILVFTELVIRYTGINYALRIFYTIIPFFLILFLYLILNFKFSKESRGL